MNVINLSLQCIICPDIWWRFCIVPVPKVANTVKCDEHRPINTVSIFEKLLELSVKDQLVNFCDVNNVIVENQSGFPKGHSSEYVLLNVCEDWYKCLEKKEIVITVFLDFKRAFETHY